LLISGQVSQPGVKRQGPDPHYSGSIHFELPEEPMAAADNQLEQAFDQINELQTFLYAFLGRLEAEKLKPGQDLTPLVKEFGLELPPLLRGEPLIWEGHTTPHFAAHGGDAPVLALVRPGHVDAVGIVLGCIHSGRWTFCLECGWIWCRIVITRRF
jgi:hypothetical protein